VSNIFAKINFPDLGSHHRCVVAVLTWLNARCLRLFLGGRRQLSVLLAENLLPAAADQGQHRHHQGGNGEY
jgi:hypothetical protein